MDSIKKKLLEELIEKLSGMEDPLMGGECEDEDKASVKVMKISAEPIDEKKKKKLMEV